MDVRFNLFVCLFVCWNRWSVQSSSTNSNRKLANNNYNNAVQNCGGSGGGGDNSWYVGMGQCMGSNVAYALYGVLPSDTIGRKQSPCSAKTFINSFFTTDGLTSFAAASGGVVDIYSLNQQCSWYGGANKYSTTTGCSATGRFTTDTFLGSGCLGYNYNDTMDELETLNQSLETMDCSLIYSSDGKVNYASSLLYKSEACTTNGLNKNFCPDPHKMVSTYEYNFAMAQQYPNYTVTTKTGYATSESAANFFKATASFILFASGFALFAGSAYQMMRNKRNNRFEDGISEPERTYGVLA